MSQPREVTLTKSDGSEVEVYRRLVRLDDRALNHRPFSARGDPDPAGVGGRAWAGPPPLWELIGEEPATVFSY
jgi:hypothetical protein